MKIATRVLLLLGVASIATNAFYVDKSGEEHITVTSRKNELGKMEFLEESPSLMKKTVFSTRHQITDPVHRARVLDTARKMAPLNKKGIADGSIMKCNDRGYKSPDDFYFAPVYVGQLQDQSNSLTYEGRCFQELKFNVEYFPSKDSMESVRVYIQPSKARSLLCKDWFLLANPLNFHFETVFIGKTHVIEFKNLDKQQKESMIENGMHVYMFCDGYMKSFMSVLQTLELFLGGLSDHPMLPIIGSHTPWYMIEANRKFMREMMDYDMPPRKITHIDFDEKLIHSGDYFVVTRLDGLDEIIMLGTGSRSGHSVVALWIEGELNIVESQDGWYWPTHGIQRTPFKTWIKQARNADFNVLWCPLSKENKAKFNEANAVKWFKEKEGLPYGYHNFLFSWIDTPEDNWPPILPRHLVAGVFGILDRISHATAYKMLLQALNFRLGTKNLGYQDLTAAAAEKSMTLDDVMAIPEKDGWVYNDGESYVCSCFVAGIWKAAGVFGDLDITVTEQSPKDIYQMKIFDENFTFPAVCAEANPGETRYCQIIGKNKITLSNFNKYALYDKMNEKCPSVAPKFERPDGC